LSSEGAGTAGARPVWLKVLLGCLGLGLLAGIGGCLLVYAAAESLNSARARAMEAGAAGHLRAYAESQDRHRADREKTGRAAYAEAVARLIVSDGRSYDARASMLEAMSRSGGASGAPYGGYRFREMKTVAGRPVDWSREFALCAWPGEPEEGARARLTLVVGAGGAVWSREFPEDAGPVEDFPADPASAGWKRFPTEKE